jgi:hypothetical protein
MKINNLLDKSFGPVGTSAGTVLLIIGIIMTFFYFSAIILVLLGAFIGFTSTSALIDYDKKRVKFSNNLFGIIKIGKWIYIEPDMKLGFKKSNLIWSAYSQTNRILDVADQDYRIILYHSNNKEIMPVRKTKSLDTAKVELERLGNQLGLVTILPPSKYP